MTLQSRLGLRAATVLVWALAGACAVYWGLRMAAPAATPVAVAPAEPPQAIDSAALARLLGSTPQAAAVGAPQPSLASRFALVGVLAGRSGGDGAALIAVDGKPAKPYRVGAMVESGLFLQSLGPRRAVLGDDGGPAVLSLDMQPLQTSQPTSQTLQLR